VAAPAARRPRAILPWRHPVTMGCPLRSCSQRSARGRRTAAPLRHTATAASGNDGTAAEQLEPLRCAWPRKTAS
jgi:hypothetical protein